MIKRIFTILLPLSLLMGTTRAQTSLNNAVDFTVTDLDGNSINLFSLLNQGKYVVLDFFFTTCVPCQGSAPKYKAAFQNYGCNTANVFFMSIDNGDNNAAVLAYENTYVGSGGPPMVSGVEGGGSAVVSAYGIGAFPTFILIAPNKQIVQKDMWPINAATDFDPYLSGAGLSYSSCASSAVVEVASPFHFNLFPNPVADQMTVRSVNNATFLSYRIFNAVGLEVLSGKGEGKNEISINVSTLSRGIYLAEFNTSEGNLVKKFSRE